MTWRTSWRGERADLEAADQVLTELADPPVDATSLMRDDDASAEPDDAPWVLHAYTEEPIGEGTLSMLPASLSLPTIEELAERDWVAHALEGLGLVEAGAFLLYGSHDADKIEGTDKIPLQVEANRAFGTGHHPTTSGCLEALTALRERAFRRVLDIGTGSGVLAMAARKIEPDAVIVATDIDEVSVDIARENAALNGIGDISFDTAAGTASGLVDRQGPYDLVFANILAGPLKELSSDIARQMAPDGLLILAGLLDEQKDDVLSAYEALGFDLVATGGTPRWPTLTLTTKDKTHP